MERIRFRDGLIAVGVGWALLGAPGCSGSDPNTDSGGAGRDGQVGGAGAIGGSSPSGGSDSAGGVAGSPSGGTAHGGVAGSTLGGRGGEAGTDVGGAGGVGGQGGQDNAAGSAGAGTNDGGVGGSEFTAGSGGESPLAGSGGQAGDVSSGEGGAGGATGEDCEVFVMPDDCAPTTQPLPLELRCTGLYGDWETRTRACGLREFRPAHELWSDGALKRRFMSLPPNTTIDTSDPDAFQFPVGTQFWKEFWLDKGGQRVLGETRLLRKTDLGWLYTTYVWSADGSRAEQTNDGVANLMGTGHTVPTRDQCRECHSGRADFILGWDWILLGAGATGLTRETLIKEGLVTGVGGELSIPGDSVERAALGYLHANCGVSCHNRTPEAAARTSDFYMRLEADTLESVLTTNAAVLGINQRPRPDAIVPDDDPPVYDFRPLDPARSLVIARMSIRGEAGMPRLGTNKVDPTGVALVTAWINQMTPSRGYPEPAP